MIGDRERRGFSRSGARLPQNVNAFHHQRDQGGLDWSRRLVAGFLQRFLHNRRQIHIRITDGFRVGILLFFALSLTLFRQTWLS